MYTKNEEYAPESVENAGNGAPCLKAALIYQRMGWSVVPIKPGAKNPDGSWKRFQQIAASEDAIRHWFRQKPDRGVGVVQGSVSGIVAIDIDSPTANEHLLEISKGDLPSTWLMETTPGQKWRLLYRLPPGEAPRKQILWHDANGKELAIMGDGSQVVMPPSKHPLGHHYRWIEGGPDLMPEGPAMAPEWLMALIGEPEANLFEGPGPDEVEADQVAEPDHQQPTPPSLPDRPREASTTAIGVNTRPGDWFNMQDPDELLKRLGLEFVSESDQRYYHRIGSENGAGATAKIGTDKKWDIQIHSTSIQGFPPDHYDQIGILARLDHGGDISKTASALRAVETGPNPFEGVVIDPASCAADEPTQPSVPKETAGGDADWQPPFGFVRIGDLPLEVERWLVPGLVVGGAAQIISGAPGGAKSSVIRALCCHLASGRGAMARPDGKPAICVWGVTEDSPRTLTSTAVAEGLSAEETRRIIVTDSLEKRIVDPNLRQDVIRWLRKESVELLIIDTLSKAATTCGFKINDAEGARGILDPCAEISRAVPGLSVVVLSHTVKSADVQGQNRVAGSTQVNAAVRMSSIIDPCEGGVVLKEEKTNNFKHMHTWTFKQVALSAHEARANLQAGGWTIKEEEFEDLLETFKRQEVTWTPHNENNRIDPETGRITIGMASLPMASSAKQKRMVDAEVAERSIVSFLKVSGGSASFVAIKAKLDRSGIKRARFENALECLKLDGRVEIEEKPGRGNPKVVNLVSNLSDIGGVDAYET